ncbi:MAG: hypothetical protein ISR69_06170 [Gammaproteobacteria bacterium]|nr:hypothetical protein [Gammaproteobacteria bacterium]
MARLKSSWNFRDKQRSMKDIGSALSFNIWQISGNGVLELENEGFQTDTKSQRLDVLCEYAAYLLQLADRMTYDILTEEQRNQLISAAGLHLASIIQDNRYDTEYEKAEGKDYIQEFLSLLNSRINDYSGCKFSSIDGPSFVFLRLLGDHVTLKMGEKDKKWITSYVIDISGDKLFKAFRRILPGLLDPAKKLNEKSESELDLGKNYDV